MLVFVLFFENRFSLLFKMFATYKVLNLQFPEKILAMCINQPPCDSEWLVIFISSEKKI